VLALEASFTGMTKTGEIITQFPMATQILDKYRIDFCCLGDRPIIEAIKENNLSEKEVLGRLNQLYSESKKKKVPSTNWSNYSPSELIEYIIENHHRYLYKTLPEISRLTAKILTFHGSTHPELQQVYNLYNDLKIEIEQHVIREEEVVFPLIELYEIKPSKKQLLTLISTFSTLEDEHLTNTEILTTIREATNNYALPKNACLTYQLTFIKLQELEADLMEHMHLENNILLSRYFFK
jgi:regulator of cell morphogenesis and NO signaling